MKTLRVLFFSIVILLYGWVALPIQAQTDNTVGVYISVQLDETANLNEEDIQEIINAVPGEWLSGSQATARYEIVLNPSIIDLRDCDYTVDNLPVTSHLKRVDINLTVIDRQTDTEINANFFVGNELLGCPGGGTFTTIDGVPVDNTIYYIPDAEDVTRWLYEHLDGLPDLVTGKLFQLAAFEFNQAIGSVSANPDGQFIAITGEDSIAHILDRNTGEELFQLDEQGDELLSVSLSSKGDVIATGDTAGVTRIWSMDSREIITTLDNSFGEISAIDFSPDGSRIITNGGLISVEVWDTYTGEQLLTTPTDDIVVSLKFSPDGNLIAVGFDHMIQILDAHTGEMLFENSDLRGEVLSIDFSANGQFVAMSSADTDLRLWDLESNTIHTLTGHTDEVTGVFFVPDKNILLSSSLDGTVRFWSTDEPGELHVLTLDQDTATTNVISNVDGNFIIVTQVGDGIGGESRVTIWDATTLMNELQN